MKQRTIAVLTIVFVSVQSYAAQVYSLFNAHRAMRVDDILTVVVVESAKAGSQSGTNTNKQNEMSLQANNGTGVLRFLPSFGASGSSKVSFDGKGGTSREGNLVAKVSARVTQVLDNGNLVIDGGKQVVINEEKEIIKVSGVVRPQDIESNNTIYSYNIADAQITYSGKGAATQGQRPGLLARILNWIF